MSTQFKVVAKRNPQDATAPPKYYPSVQSTGRLTLRQLARRISEFSTVSSADTMAVLEGLLTVIPVELSNGNIVELGDFGSFWLRIQSKGVVVETELTSRHIKNTLPRFTPGKEFKQVLAGIEYRKA